MLESILFLFLIFVGAIFAMISFVMMVVGLLSKSKLTTKVGTWMLSVPAICFGIIFLFYAVVRPWSQQKIMEEYSGRYLLQDSNAEIILTLKNDGTYVCDPLPRSSFSIEGTWNTKGVDGLFELRENDGRLHFLSNGVLPDGDLVVRFVLSEDELEFIKINQE